MNAFCDPRALKAALAAALGLAFAIEAEAKTYRIKPGPSAQSQLEAAAAAARDGDTIRLDEGRYALRAPIVFRADKLEFKGEGPEKTILSFQDATGIEASLKFTGDENRLRDFAVENPPMIGIATETADRLTIDRVLVEWTQSAKSADARGIYIKMASEALIDRTAVRGAPDAGLEIAQSGSALVRDSQFDRNSVGLRLTNVRNGEIQRNLLARNFLGAQIVDLPGAPAGGPVRIVGNAFRANEQGPVKPPERADWRAKSPVGSGLAIIGADNVHVIENTFTDHSGAHARVLAFPGAIADPAFDAIPRENAFRGNRFTPLKPGPGPSAHVIWDGASIFIAGGQPRTAGARISLAGNEAPEGDLFLNLGIASAGGDPSDGSPSREGFIIAPLPEPKPLKLKHDDRD